MRKADKPSAIYLLIASKMRDPQRVTTLWASMVCYKDSFMVLFTLQTSEALSCYISGIWSQYVSSGIVTGCWLDVWGLIIDKGKVSLLHSIQTTSEAFATSYPAGTRGNFPWSKALGHESDHSLSSSPKVPISSLHSTQLSTRTALHFTFYLRNICMN
jgi:hypothetical protein